MSRLFGELSSTSTPQGPQSASRDAEGFDLGPYLAILRRRWRVVAAAVTLALIAAVIHYWITPRKYRATARIQIERRSVTAATGEFNPWLEGYWGIEFYPTQYELLKSRGLAERVVRNLRLWNDPQFQPVMRSPSRDSDGQPISVEDDNAMMGKLANRLLGGLQIDPVRDTQLVRVSYVSSSPELAAKITNGVVDAYIRMGISSRATDAEQAAKFLEQEIDSLKGRIADDQAQLSSYQQQQYKAGFDTADAEVSKQRLDQLNQERTDAVNDRISKKTAYDRLMATPDRDLVDLNNGAVGDLRKQLLADQRKYDSMSQTYKPDWPEMVELKNRINQQTTALQKLIKEQADTERATARAEWQAAASRERALTAELRQTGSQSLEAKTAANKYQSLRSELDSLQKELEDKQKRLLTMGSTSRMNESGGSNIRVVDRALMPTGPFRPSLRRDVTMALALGLFLGIGLIALLEFLDRSIKDPDQMARVLDLPTLAVIPDVTALEGTIYSEDEEPPGGRKKKTVARLRTATGRSRESNEIDVELIPHAHPRMAASEAYRGLRTALLLSSAETLRVVTVTSAEAGEGKSATVTNLAVVMAQLGRKTLLVDADLRRPRLHKLFGLSNRVGLVSYLAGGVDIQEIYAESSVPNLFVTPCGPLPPNPSELLSSDRMQQFLQQVRSDFDFVLIDSPPTLAVTDSTILGNRSDGVVLCFRSNKIQRDAALRCRDRLQLGEVRILGCVLNRFRATAAGRNYAQYYAEYGPPEPASSTDSAA